MTAVRMPLFSIGVPVKWPFTAPNAANARKVAMTEILNAEAALGTRMYGVRGINPPAM